MTSLLLLAALAQIEQPTCHVSGDEQACGFHCRAELGQVRCAQTPEGFCTRIEGQLTCWDPPDEVRWHPVEGGPIAHCQAKYREVACGYACLSAPSHLACAQTPFGVCSTRFDEVTCWDPSPGVLHFYSAAELKGASCLQSDRGFACGWSCKKSYQAVQCAQTPKGTCSVIDGRIACFDPPIPPVTHAPTKAK